MFLDEPTSGLDSSTSSVLINILKNLAKRRGINIILTIHQPSSNIFNLFDKLIFLNSGNTIYQGPVHDCVKYFNDNIEHVNEKSNPADAIMHLVETKNSIQQGDIFYKTYEKVIKDDFENNMDAIIRSSNTKMDEINAMFKRLQKRAGFLTSFRVLLWRTWIGYTRNSNLIVIKVLANLWLIFLCISVFQLTDDVAGARTRASLMYFYSIVLYFLNVFSTQVSLPKELAVIKRDVAGNTYKVLPYYLAKNVVETPIAIIFAIVFVLSIYWSVHLRTDSLQYAFNNLVAGVVISYFAGSLGYFLGAFFTNTGIAMILLNVTTLGFQLLSGFLVSAKNMPPGLSLVRYISPFFYGIQALMRNEFDGNNRIPPGNNIPENIGLEEFSVWTCIIILAIYATILRIAAYFSLSYTMKK